MLETFIQKFLFRCTAKNLASGTMKTYETTLKRFDEYATAKGVTNIADVTDDVIMLYLTDRGKVVKKVTVKGDYVTLKTFFCFLEKKKLLAACCPAN